MIENHIESKFIWKVYFVKILCLRAYLKFIIKILKN